MKKTVAFLCALMFGHFYFCQTIFWSNDFSNCNDWDTYNAWEEGYNDFVSGINFDCSTFGPEGGAAIDAINSTTAKNGFMMVDSDNFANETGVENCWFQNVNPIDCSIHDQVILRFETYYRMWDGGSSDGNEYCLLEVSNDGVTCLLPMLVASAFRKSFLCSKNHLIYFFRKHPSGCFLVWRYAPDACLW